MSWDQHPRHHPTHWEEMMDEWATRPGFFARVAEEYELELARDQEEADAWLNGSDI